MAAMSGACRFHLRHLDPAKGPILYPGSRDLKDLEGTFGKAGFDVTRLVLYDAVALSMPLYLLARIYGVLLFWPRSAASRMLAGRPTGRGGPDSHYCLSAKSRTFRHPSPQAPGSTRGAAIWRLIQPFETR
jgi:hypothetical protein